MSKLLLPLLCLCLAIWLFGGSYWFAREYTQDGPNKGWTVTDGKQVFHSETIFSFQYADPEIILDDNQWALITQIGEYLDANPDRALVITGDYTEEEMNNSQDQNLGKARAESFRYLIYRLGIDLERIIVKERQVKSHVKNENGLINGGVNFDFVESPLMKYGEAFSFEKRVHFDQNDAIDRSKNSYELYLAALRQYMVDFPTKKIKLSAAYSKEVTASFQKRMDTLISDLKNQGIDESRIEVESRETVSVSSEDLDTIDISIN